jgi:hypothetical protein
MALPDNLTFHSWQRSSLLDEGARSGGRLRATLNLTMTDQATGNTATGAIPYGFVGAADITCIQRSAIKHLAPAPFTPDAEVTKFPHVDFWDADFPWRYTPRARANDQVPPWLVLLAGTVDELQVAGTVVNVTTDAPLRPVDLAREGHLWAHVQYDGVRKTSRVLCARRDLPANSECVAVLVPTFGETGEPIWIAEGATSVRRQFGPTGVLTALFSWRFWTASEGDFETLATALRIREAGQTGLATLRYRRAAQPGADPVKADLQIRGAITSMKLPPDSDEEEATARRVAADLAVLTADVGGPDKPALSMPAYGRPWLPDPKAIQAGWPHELNTDPRNRGIAGLGVWMGIEAQEALMDAAVQQAGALREAGQLINHLAFGLASSGSLWTRRLPTNPRQRLRVLGPMMDRLTDESGARALDRVTALPSPFPPSFFSGAGQRILRSRSGHTRHLAGYEGGFDVSLATTSVNQPDPQPQKAPDGLPHIDHFASELGVSVPDDFLGLDTGRLAFLMEVIERALEEFTRHFLEERSHLLAAGAADEIPNLRNRLGEELLAAIDAILSEDNFPCPVDTMLESITSGFDIGSYWQFSGWALADALFRDRLLEGLRDQLWRCLGRDQCEGEWVVPGTDDLLGCNDVIDMMPPPPPPLHRPIDIDGLVGGLVGLLDPRLPDAPARLRVCGRLEGVDCSRLVPTEYPIGLDFPTWDLLRQYEKEWLLPGARSLPPDSITALQTNPAFIDAFMTGINAQFLAEMRWRDLAVEHTCTPLRMFWGQVDSTTGQRKADIEPIWTWAAAPGENLGSLQHQTLKPDNPANASGSRLVIAFHTDLFRRYPSTLVYLVRTQTGPDHDAAVVDPLLKATPELDMPAGANPETWRQNRVFLGPVFSGAIKPDLVFFTFDIAPSDLEQYWLVLDEPPAELRFRAVPALQGSSAAEHAKLTLDTPTRVAIDGKELRAMGMA